MDKVPSGRIYLDLVPYDREKISNTTENNGSEICEALSEPYLLVVSVAPALVAIENLVFLVAALLYRRKLKRNNVNTYVTSALLANVVTSLWAFYHFLNYYYGIESRYPSNWWAFRKGMTAGFCLILCGNVGLLIYAIEDNTYLVGRIVAGNSASKKQNKLNPKKRMQRALCHIAFVWVIPVMYGLLSMTPWNCTDSCDCTLHYASGKPICQGEKCSRLYTPMSKSYLLCVVILWAIECSFLLATICRSATSFPTIPSSSDCNETTQSQEMKAENSSNNTGRKSFVNLKKITPRLQSSYKFPFVLLGMFIGCTAPVMILFVLDFAIADFHCSSLTINIVTPLPLLYCVISPILLTKRLQGMRWAIYNTLSFSWMKSGCGDVRKRKLGKGKGGSSHSVNRNSEGKVSETPPVSAV